jgi:hypothetical protein
MLDDTFPTDLPADGRLDRMTMRTLGRRVATHPLVDSWAFDPDSLSPRSLNSTAYPDPVNAARIDVRWFVTNDY